MYLRKNDMDEPPRFDEDGDSENSGQRLKHHAKRYEDPLHLQVKIFSSLKPGNVFIAYINLMKNKFQIFCSKSI
jgi:hypothetical protein